ncbi:MAG: phosphodiester glycosidase family protein [Solirubrobacterales bacterium]|nr:phosphodiester glycosidase family protein [Solirubrobacterales bacterium]
MSARPSPLQSLRSPLRPRHLTKLRVLLPGRARTTLYVASYPADEFEVGVELLPEPLPLETWCRATGASEAMIGGFFARPGGIPLGEVRTRGVRRDSIPFDAPWDAIRACVHVEGGRLHIARRDELPAEPVGDLLQAGPLLLAGGELALDGDIEGFSAGSSQFDSDITQGRYPRAALAIAGDRILAVACDGRANRDAGLTLAELAGALGDLGATDAINLDGGGSASLVCGGRLRNRPREEHGVVIEAGRPISSALVFNRT